MLLLLLMGMLRLLLRMCMLLLLHRSLTMANAAVSPSSFIKGSVWSHP
jgi:hypothetical protein